MNANLLKGAAVLGFVAALAAGAPSAAVAAPFKAGHGEALKSAQESDVIQVHRRYRHGRYWAYGIGGLALGAALAAPYYRGGYYGPGYGAYGPAPKCWYQTGPYRGQGYWGYC